MVRDLATRIGWIKHRIKDFGVISTGTTPSTKTEAYYGGNYKLISPADLTDSKYILTAHKFITEDGLKVARTVPKNAVLVGCIGNVGKIGITKDEVSAFNQQINAIACNDNFDVDFVYYLLRYKKPELENKAAKVTVPILNKNNFENIEFDVPSLFEQKSIARILTTVQEAIASQEALIEKLKELKKSMMQHLFTRGTKNEKTKMTEIGEIPESWNVVVLGDVCKQQNDIYYPNSQGNKKYIGLEHITSGELTIMQSGSEKDVKSTKVIFSSENVLYGKLRPYLDKAAIPVFNGIASTDIIILRGEKIQNRFLVLLLHTEDFLKYAKQTTSGVNHPRTSWKDINKYKFALPKENEREQISDVIWGIEKRIEACRNKLLVYRAIFETLLNELMNGNIRIKAQIWQLQ